MKFRPSTNYSTVLIYFVFYLGSNNILSVMRVTKAAKLISNFAYGGVAITARFKSSSIWYTSLQSVEIVPSPEGWSWCEMDGKWKPVWMTLPETAKACLELLKCGCKQGCTGRCKCKKANLPCTGCYPVFKVFFITGNL